MDVLKKLRNRIDWIDSQIASLMDERMKAVGSSRQIKERSSP